MTKYWKMTPNLSNGKVLESEIPEIVARLAPIFGKQVCVEVAPAPLPEGPAQRGPDFLVRVDWHGESFEFAAEAKTANTPRVLEEALRQARRWASDSGRLPMVIVPFLGDKRIDRLLEEEVSGLDLCGNGLVAVPGRMLLRRTGAPNRYPETRPSRFAYRGTTSLVPRTFLRRAEYASVGQVRDEIEAAGGAVALSTVSKALARMADDLIIDRSGDRIRLIQPDKLLDALADSFTPPEPRRVAQAQVALPLADVFRLAAPKGARTRAGLAPRLVLAGTSSQDRYAAGLRADRPTLYCEDVGWLRQRLGERWRPTERFPDLTAIETTDPTAYFDARPDELGVAYASPVQTYLELARGEKRDQEMAVQVRDAIIRGIDRGPKAA